jgi:hypothetical protein
MATAPKRRQDDLMAAAASPVNAAPTASDVPGEGRRVRLVRNAQNRYTRLEQGRRTGLFVAVGKRFVTIDGGVFGALMAIELFTTVLPLIILGFGYFSGFAKNASVGNMFIDQLGLTGTTADTVRAAFGSSKALQSSWTVIGLLGWLVWGIPMAITVAGMFAKAWRREQFTVLRRLGRGIVWFVLYLAMLVVRERIAFGISRQPGPQVGLFLVSLVPMWLFWTVTPVSLVRDGSRGKKFLAQAGLAGVVIDGVILALGTRLVFPSLLSGWTLFGPIGVAMALMTWCGVLGFGWVVIACFSAVLWERAAPIPVVIAAQTGA